MIHYFNPGEKILSLRILITPNHALTWRKKKHSPLLLSPPLLKAVYLAPRQRSHQGRPLESLGPPSFFFFRPLRLQSHLEEDLEAPFVVFPWNKTNRIQVFWLALASRSRQRLPPVMWARSCDFRGEPRRSYLCIEMRPAGLERMSANFLPTSNLVTKYREC